MKLPVLDVDTCTRRTFPVLKRQRAGNCTEIGEMLTRFKTPIETFRRNSGVKDAERRRTDHHRPSGRLGGPGVAAIRKDESLPLKIGMDSYSTVVPFDDALKRLRKALSRSGFEILRECDIGSQIGRAHV